jgi:hypothetical protein
VPPFDSSDDAIGFCGPDEGLGGLIVFVEIAVDGGFEIADGAEDAAPEPAPGKCSEEALDRIQPGAGGGDEVESEALVPCKPCHHLGMLMGGIVIEDEVDGRLGRYGGIDRFEKSDELLMSVAFHATADHPAFEDIEGGEQRRCAVSFVVMGHGPCASRLHRQPRLSSIECLNLALLVEREDEGVRRWIDIESDHIPELLSEFRIARELEGFDPMRGEMMSTPDALDRTRADADRLGHGGRRPMGGLVGRIRGGKRQHAVDLILSQRGDSRGAGLVTQQSGGSFRHETFLPAPDTGLGLPRPMHDFDRADAVRRQKHDPCPPDMLLRCVPIADNRLELTPLRGGNGDGNPGAHAPDSHAPRTLGIPLGIQMLDLVH